jgi:hypothetical protein
MAIRVAHYVGKQANKELILDEHRHWSGCWEQGILLGRRSKK